MKIEVEMGVSLRRIDPGEDELEYTRAAKNLLGRDLNTERVVCFVGSGVSNCYGYPSWSDFVTEVVQTLDRIAVNKTSRRNDLPKPLDTLLECFRKPKDKTPSSDNSKKFWSDVFFRLQSTFDISRSDRILILLDQCREYIRERSPGTFEAIIKGFEKPRRPLYDANPIRKLIETLRVRRFVTTNYDFQIESEFQRLGVEFDSADFSWNEATLLQHDEASAVSPRACSLTAENEAVEKILLFATGAPGYERGVFHCHGIATKPERAVVSERDYQRVYADPAPDVAGLRAAMELIFSSNAVLFVGLGMSEPDLLRPLRQFVAERPETIPERPVFALMEQSGEPHERDEFRRFLHTRYGVKTIFYEVGDRNSREERARSLGSAIDDVAKCRIEWWRRWQEKPPVRQPPQREEKETTPHRRVVYHPQVHPSEDLFKQSQANENRIREALEAIGSGSNGKRILIFHGPPGTGKGRLGLQIARGDNERSLKGIQRAFFATTHFSNDFLSILDGAASFLDPKADQNKHPIQRLLSALESRGNLLVLGGIERLLKTRTWFPGDGESLLDGVQSDPPFEAATPGLRRLFEGIQSDSVNSIVVLTTTKWPVHLARGSNSKAIEVTLTGPDVNSVIDKFAELLPKGKDREVSEIVTNLYQALDGHLYALFVTRAFLKQRNDLEKNLEWLGEVVSWITAVDKRRRPEHLIRSIIECDPKQDSTRRYLQCVSLVTTPVRAVDVAVSLGKNDRIGEVEAYLENLRERGLICAVESGSEKSRYTTHTIVRSFVNQLFGIGPLAPAEPHRFLLPGYSAEAEQTETKSKQAHELATRCVDRLLRQAIDEVSTKNDLNNVRGLSRAAFGIIRSGWHALGLSALADFPRGTNSHYDAYYWRLVQLVYVLRHAGNRSTWRWSKGTDRMQIETRDGILYGDEMAWLFNELGLAAFSKGVLVDALSLWNYGREINTFVERGAGGRRTREASLGSAVAMIERGNLGQASELLSQLVTQAHRDGDVRRQARALGYLGWIHHLRLETDTSFKLYQNSLDLLARHEVRRGLSVFHRLCGDLHRYLGHYEVAKDHIRSSIAAAERGGHTDLVQFARLASASLLMAQQSTKAAQGVDRLLIFAQDMGIHRLESDAYKIMGEIALSTGDLEGAARFTRRALSLSAKHGMKLRLTGALVLMGRIAAACGRRAEASSIYEAAVAAGKRMGYHLQTEKAESGLRELG